jgi:hypothetical protein
MDIVVLLDGMRGVVPRHENDNRFCTEVEFV